DDVGIPAALAGRFFGRWRTRKIDAISLWWIAFLIWLTAEAVIGIGAQNNRTLLYYEAKAILYIGLFVLAAGVDSREYLAHRRLERFLFAAGILPAVIVILDQSHVRIRGY